MAAYNAKVDAILTNLRSAWPLLLVILVGTLLRCWAAGESLWLDELHSAWCVEGEWNDVAPRAQIGNNSPLYFRLCWLITRAGLNEWTLRAPSLVAGLTLLLLIYGIARRWTDHRGISALAAFAAALDSNFIFYSVEARPYALIQLLATAHFFVLIERLCGQEHRWQRAMFICGGALLVYLHYTAALMLITELAAIGVLAILLPSTRSPAARGLVDLLLIGVLCLGMVAHAEVVFGRRTDWSSVVGTPVWQDLLRAWNGGWYALPAILLVVATRFIAPAGRKADAPTTIRWICLLLWWLMPVTVCWISTRGGLAPLMLSRYLAGASAAPLLIAATNINSIHRLRPLSITALLIASATLTYSSMYQADPPTFFRQENWRLLARELDNSQGPILLRSGLLEADRLQETNSAAFYDYCRFPLRSLYKISAPERVVPLRNLAPRLVVQQISERLADSSSAWLILRTARGRAEQLAGQILNEGPLLEFEIGEWHSFGRLQAVRLVRRREKR